MAKELSIQHHLNDLIRVKEALAQGDFARAGREMDLLIEAARRRFEDRWGGPSVTYRETVAAAEAARALPVPTLSPVASPSSRTPP